MQKNFGYKFKFKVDFRDENVNKVFKLAIPVIISTAVLPINSLVSTRLASGMGENAVAAIEYAYKLYLVVSGVFTYAIGNIIFPELSRANADKDEESYINLIHKAMRILSYILIPLTIGIIIYREDIVSTIYERGEFDANSTLMTSGALLYYAIGIIGSGFVEIMNKAFYAKQDTKSPLKTGIFVIIINIILSILFGNLMSFKGLALATSISSIINATILILIYSQKQRRILDKKVIYKIVKMLFCALAMGIFVYVLNGLLIGVLSGTILKNIIRMVIGAVVGVIFYYLLTMLFKVNEINFLKLKGGLDEEN